MPDPMFHMISGGPRPVAPFSHAVEVNGWVIMTGQMPTDPDAPDAPLPTGVEAPVQGIALVMFAMSEKVRFLSPTCAEAKKPAALPGLDSAVLGGSQPQNKTPQKI